MADLGLSDPRGADSPSEIGSCRSYVTSVENGPTKRSSRLCVSNIVPSCEAKRCCVACVPLRASWRYPRRTHIDGEEIRSSPGISGRAGVSSLWNALCRAFDPWRAKGSARRAQMHDLGRQRCHLDTQRRWAQIVATPRHRRRVVGCAGVRPKRGQLVGVT